MVQMTVLLLVLAIAALVAEIYTGTEIFGALGVVMLVVSAVMAVLFVPGGWFIVAGQVAVLALFVKLSVKHIREKQLQGKLILRDTLAEDLPEQELRAMIGKRGIAMTMLRPYGEAEFDGLRIEVSTGGPMIEQGAKIIATTVRESKLIVQESQQGN
ncbi:MAG: NfeD family protein [Defluviitaleaceae bacterium]|nr:NfeD family protein [Defluviitaleaceae bacterium]